MGDEPRPAASRNGNSHHDTYQGPILLQPWNEHAEGVSREDAVRAAIQHTGVVLGMAERVHELQLPLTTQTNDLLPSAKYNEKPKKWKIECVKKQMSSVTKRSLVRRLSRPTLSLTAMTLPAGMGRISPYTRSTKAFPYT